ncbi:MAG: family 43 glycosylhydrolase [Clostridia bacterium]|nr:family 43 glycosylhydrolase [Clostridia bacterium]
MKKLLLLLLVLVCLTIAVSAKETVVYENDFSSGDLSAFKMKGTMKAENGYLKAFGSETSAYIAYDLPAEYRGKDYRVEVDYIGTTSMGGLLVGATGNKLTQTPSYFSGYTATTSGTGKVYIAYFSQTGWGGNFAPGTNNLPTSDIHMSVAVYKGAMTFRTETLDGKLIQEFRYEPGDHSSDIYDTFTSTTGIRQYCNDKGHFDNFKVTVIEDDILPTMNTPLTLGATAFKASGLTVAENTVSGSGAMLSDAALSGNYKFTYSIANKNVTRVYFGMRDAKNGYAVELDEKEQEITLFAIKDGVFSILHKRAFIIREGYCDFTVDVHDGIASIYYNNFYQTSGEMPKIEYYLDNLDGKFGVWLNGGKAQLLYAGASDTALPEEWFINPVNSGADPDVLFYKGTYYLYVYENSGLNYFRLYTSPDLVHFTKRDFVFFWDPLNFSAVNSSTPWSPNVFYNESDGLFYLTFAAEQNGLNDKRHIYYAHSDSPFGPFIHEGPLDAVNPDPTLNEIDGHAFTGYDGKTYMSFSRYDEGGTIWLEEVIIKDGVITGLPDTATRVVIPDREWDNDGALRLCEGGFVWKHDGYYYIVYATGSFSRHYGEAYAVSKDPLGPYVKYDFNPILNWNSVIDGPGDSLIIPSPDGEELYMVHHRHRTPDNGGNPRDTCIALMDFVKDPDGGPDILVVKGPSSTPMSMPSNKYRFDVNRDGVVNLADALKVLTYMRSDADYSGYYDVDANGTIGMGDVIAILEKFK